MDDPESSESHYEIDAEKTLTISDNSGLPEQATFSNVYVSLYQRAATGRYTPTDHALASDLHISTSQNALFDSQGTQDHGLSSDFNVSMAKNEQQDHNLSSDFHVSMAQNSPQDHGSLSDFNVSMAKNEQPDHDLSSDFHVSMAQNRPQDHGSLSDFNVSMAKNEQPDHNLSSDFHVSMAQNRQQDHDSSSDFYVSMANNTDNSNTAEIPKQICTERCTDHPDEVIKYYCPADDFLGCSAGIILGHKLCNVDYIPDKCSDIEKSDEYKDVISNIDRNLHEVDALVKTAKEKDTLVDTCHKKATDSIDKFQKELTDQINAKCKQAKLKANKMRNSHKEKVSDMLKSCDGITTSMQQLKATIEDNKGHSGKMFIAIKRAKSRLNLSNDLKQVKGSLKQLNVKYTFKPDKNLQYNVMRCNEFGQLSSDTPTDIKPKVHQKTDEDLNSDIPPTNDRDNRCSSMSYHETHIPNISYGKSNNKARGYNPRTSFNIQGRQSPYRLFQERNTPTEPFDVQERNNPIEPFNIQERNNPTEPFDIQERNNTTTFTDIQRRGNPIKCHDEMREVNTIANKHPNNTATPLYSHPTMLNKERTDALFKDIPTTSFRTRDNTNNAMQPFDTQERPKKHHYSTLYPSQKHSFNMEIPEFSAIPPYTQAYGKFETKPAVQEASKPYLMNHSNFIKISTETDLEPCEINACALLSRNRLILVDSANKKVKLVSLEASTVIDEKCLDSPPTDVTLVSAK